MGNVRAFVGALAALGAALAIAQSALAAAPAPWLLDRARGTPQEADVREQIRRWSELRTRGVDQVHQEFALAPSRYPRGGVARRNILVALVQFPSDQFGTAVTPSSHSTPSYYQRIFFSDDPNDGITSVREYYREISNGRLLISGQVTSKWMNMPHSQAYYVNGSAGLDFGSYPRSAQKLAEDAMSAAYSDFGGKLGYFDNDGLDGVSGSGDDDGYIDAVCVIHPGVGGEVVSGVQAFNYLWSHEAGVAVYSNCPGTGGGPECLPGIPLGSVRGFLYTMTAEFNESPGDNAVGTYCHEFGHTIGLPDLYDPNAAGLGFYSLMGLGNYLPFYGEAPFGSGPGSLDAWSRQYLGFDPIVTPKAGGHYTLGPATGGGGSLRVWSHGEPGSEYFLLENRERTGVDRYLPGDGLLIYHVDDRNQDNLSGPSLYRVRVVPADSVSLNDLESSVGNFGDDKDFWPGTLLRRSWTESTTPNSRDYDGFDTGVRLANITGGTPDFSDSVSFDLVLSTQPELRITGIAYADGGDDHPDPSETGDLTLQLTNVGTNSNALTYTLSSLDALVTVTQSASAGGALATGASGANTTPFTVQFGAPVTLPRGVSLRLAWNDGTASGTQDFALTIGEASGLSENFESDFTASGWSSAAVSPSLQNEWHRTQVRAQGGTYAAKVGSANALGSGTNEQQTYRNNEDAALVSPGFSLPANSQLSFWSWIDSETNGGTGAWDGARVELSLAGGPWLPLALDGGYPYIIEFNAGTALNGASVIAGSSGAWRKYVADLSGYSGPARVRFRFASDDTNEPRDQFGSLARYYEGWYVDNVAVEARQETGPAPRHVAFRAGPTPYFAGTSSSGSIHFRMSASDGLPHPGERPVIRIFDLNGRLVRAIEASPDGLVPSEFGAAWNGQNSAGSPVGAGIYFAKVELLGQTQTTRLVVVR
ncbi:MAG TPA: M6 family metalloprotease domain-containing protein [Candidatus Eisenbacteria bacterium]|nr:M6 family metalloprotease domain-containing protein [Candidatus Eisenbacteria bacterium]